MPLCSTLQLYIKFSGDIGSPIVKICTYKYMVACKMNFPVPGFCLPEIFATFPTHSVSSKLSVDCQDDISSIKTEESFGFLTSFMHYTQLIQFLYYDEYFLIVI